MMVKDHLFWKKDDIGITRAPAPLSDQQKIRAEKTLSVVAEQTEISLHKIS
jgi:hypothetical protein